MNQRKTSGPVTGTRVAAVLVVVALVIGLVYWFALRDDDSAGDGDAAPTAPATPKTFTAPGNSFTFQYPATFAETEGAEARGYVWIAGVGPYDFLNVKRIENQPTAPARLADKIRKSLAGDSGVTITGEGTDQRAGVDMVTFDVASKVNDLELRSTLYYFSTNGVTWQLECGSQAQRAIVDTACARALATFKTP